MNADGIEKVVNTKISDVVGMYLDDIVKFGKKKIDQKISVKYLDLKAYLEKAHARCSTVRLLIVRDRLYKIEDVYVKGSFKSSSSEIDDDAIVEKLDKGSKIIIQGFGGIGKTMLLKNIWMSFFKSQSRSVPIYVELRRLNEISTVNLSSYLRAYISPDRSTLSEDVFHTMMRDGMLVFLLDGFDELNDDIRREVSSQINSLSYDNPKCGFIVSSRADDRFISWEQFEIFHAQPFNQSQIIDVIAKV